MSLLMIGSTGDEVYFTGYVFSMEGTELSDEGAGTFHIDDPMARL